MARDHREGAEEVSSTEADHSADQPSDRQNWKPIVIHLFGGGGITGALYAASRLFSHPYDGWAIALGWITAIVATGFLVHDFTPEKKGRIVAICAFAIMFVILVIGRWTEDIWEEQERTLASSNPYNMTVGPVILTSAFITGLPTAISVLYPKSLSPVDMTLFVTVENKQSNSADIQSYGLELADTPAGPWERLCPVDAIGGQLWMLSDGSHPIELDFSNGLQRQLIGTEIGAHESVSGWTIWECPTGCRSPKTYRFSIIDAAG